MKEYDTPLKTKDTSKEEEKKLNAVTFAIMKELGVYRHYVGSSKSGDKKLSTHTWKLCQEKAKDRIAAQQREQGRGLRPLQ
jgi:hypothetical protein